MINLRKNILKVKVKFHSSYKKYFDDDSYDVDIATYSDILFYLKGMHPRFANYIHQIENGDINEYIGLVDSKFKVLINSNSSVVKLSNFGKLQSTIKFFNVRIIA